MDEEDETGVREQNEKEEDNEGDYDEEDDNREEEQRVIKDVLERYKHVPNIKDIVERYKKDKWKNVDEMNVN